MTGATFLKPAPQPGDGAYFLRNGASRRRRNRRGYPVTTFLKTSKDDAGYMASSGTELESRPESFLCLTYEVGKEQTTLLHQSRVHEPRTINTDSLLSSAVEHSRQPRQLAPHCASFLVNTTKTDHASDCNAPSKSKANSELDDGMAIPPHLRPKKAHSTSQTSKQPSTSDTTTPKDNWTWNTTPTKETSNNDTMPSKRRTNDKSNARTPASASIQKPSQLITPPPSDPNHTDIREKIESLDVGVKISEPKPASLNSLSLVPYPSSDEGDACNANVESSKPKQTKKPAAKLSSTNEVQYQGRNVSQQPPKRGDRNASRGRGRGRGGAVFAQPPPTSRDAKWPKNSEMAADPHRWDIKWDQQSSPGSIDSVRADSGRGGNKKKRKDIDSETGFKLTGWDGDWAPAPVDWDARPAFRDNQSARQIETWMDTTENAMERIEWSVAIDELIAANDACGEIAPRYWIPLDVGEESLQAFWNKLVNSTEPKPIDGGDLNGAIPWWKLYLSGNGNLLKVREQPLIEGIDPDESQNERLKRETDKGSNSHAENRKAFEKAKRDAEREKRKRAQEKSRKLSKQILHGENRETIKPDGKIYLRSAKPADLKEIRDIYNHYVTYSVCTPETERRTFIDMEQRYNDIVRNKFPFLVACERGKHIKPRRKKKHQDEEIILPDEVLGFAIADDYNDMLGMYRFTAEVEIFVHEGHYMKGIGKCLLDKMMGLLDPEYIERGGYDVEGEELEGIGESRIIQNIIINLPYAIDRPVRLEWIGKWLTNWIGFNQVGDLPKIGLKDGKNINLAIFHRTTGANIDPKNPPITGQYPKSG